jgi:hypothetical protein
MDIVDIVKNTKKIYMSESSLETLLDFERVLDQLDIYAFKNWKRGELVEGPIVERHWVTAKFMWPHKLMPDPDGAKRLLGYNTRVMYERDNLASPVAVEDYDDFRPGTKKPKLREDKVWIIEIRMPKELIQDINEGYLELEGREVDQTDLDDAYEQNLSDVTSNNNVPEGEENEQQAAG